MSEIHQVEGEKPINGASVLMTRREPKTEAERNSYWYRAYASMEKTAINQQKRIEDLEGILQAQVKTNDVAGEKMVSQDQLMESEMGTHNNEMRQMALELGTAKRTIRRLEREVEGLGGTVN